MRHAKHARRQSAATGNNTMCPGDMIPLGTQANHHSTANLPYRASCHTPETIMTTTVCILATLLAVLTIPVMVLLWATETRPQRIQRWHAKGMSQQAIADRLGTTRWQVRKALATA